MKNLNTILPFYDAVTEQYRYRSDCDVQPCLSVLNTTFIPFCIRRTHSAGYTSNLTLYFYDLDGVLKDTVTGASAGLTITSGTSYDHITYTGTALNITTGSRYLVVKDDYPAPDKLWHSETFTVVTSVTSLLKIEFYNTLELASICAAFHQIVYLTTNLKAPEYLREDTGDKRDGLLVKEKQVTMKAYIMHSLLAPEYLVDAMMLLPMMDYVTVTTQSGDALTFDEIQTVDPIWEEKSQGAMAHIQFKFIRDIVIKKLSFKETGYSNESNMTAIVKSGLGTTTADDDVFSLTVAFDEVMPDTNYTPAAHVIDSTTPLEPQVPIIPEANITVAGFKILTYIACSVRWSAVRE